MQSATNSQRQNARKNTGRREGQSLVIHCSLQGKLNSTEGRKSEGWKKMGAGGRNARDKSDAWLAKKLNKLTNVRKTRNKNGNDAKSPLASQRALRDA